MQTSLSPRSCICEVLLLYIELLYINSLSPRMCIHEVPFLSRLELLCIKESLQEKSPDGSDCSNKWGCEGCGAETVGFRCTEHVISFRDDFSAWLLNCQWFLADRFGCCNVYPLMPSTIVLLLAYSWLPMIDLVHRQDLVFGHRSEQSSSKAGRMVTPTPALKPPPGVVSNFVDPPTLTQKNNISIGICVPATTIFFFLRCYVRACIKRTWIFEDCNLSPKSLEIFDWYRQQGLLSQRG